MDTKVYSKTFLWLCLGLLITFVTGFYVCTNENMIYNIFTTNAYWIIFLVEIVLVLALSAGIRKMPYWMVVASYALYSFVSGLTFASIFLLFDLTSIILIFGVAALMFAAFGTIGYFTKINLSKISTILFMGLLTILIMSLINLFVGNTIVDIIVCGLGILLFVGYIAYDMQKIKYLSEFIDERKLPIYGAFQLYLDFVNLFIYLLRLFGKRSD